MNKRIDNYKLFLDNVSKKFGDEYEFLSEYKTTKINITIKHKKCGHIFKRIPSSFLMSRGCPICAKKNPTEETINNRKNAAKKRTKTHEQFLKEVKDLYNDDYTILNTYINSHTKIKVRHNICNHIWDVLPHSLLNFHGCPKCAGKLSYTTKTYKDKVFELVGNEYEVLGKYVNSYTKIKIKHNTCGHIWDVLPSSIISTGTRCPICSKKNIGEKIKKTHEEFLKDVEKVYGDEYTIIGKYIDSNTKVLLRHNICGYEWYVSPSSFISAKRKSCPQCSKRIPYNTKTFSKEVHNITNGEYEVIGEYNNINSPIKIRHNLCGFEWFANSNSFINKGSRCPKCAGKLKYTTEMFVKKMFDLVEDEYELLSEYIYAHKKVYVRHNICGHEYYTTPHNFLRGSRCPKCYGNIPYTTQTFKEKLKEIVGDEYELLSEYKNSNTKVLLKHVKCGHIWWANPMNILLGSGCPLCNSSKGERRIRKYLLDNNISFTDQYYFDDCLSIKGNPLLFDFAIFKNKQMFLIEYDGKQHFEPIQHFGGEKIFKEQKERDLIKDNYCIINNISLLRIPYFEYKNINIILDNYLNN